MKKLRLNLAIFLLLTLTLTPVAVAQKQNIITNETTETLYVLSSTKFGAQGAIPDGYRTSGWKAIKAGQQRTFWAYDPHKIYFQIWKGTERIKPQPSTQTFAFWIHRTAHFDIVARQEINGSISRDQLVYSSHDTRVLTQSDGFMLYNNGANITVTNAWVRIDAQAPIDDTTPAQITVPNPDTTPVHIPDPNLRSVIENALGKAAGTTITQADMRGLTQIKAPEMDLQSIRGLEFATNLRYLSIGGNDVSDISPLKNLINLTELDIWGNDVSDISPLKNLIHLTDLSIHVNQVSDISPLKNLIKLTRLDIWENDVSDISLLKNLIHLTRLSISHNDVSDISPLKNLINLTELSIGGNDVSDISPLKNLINLTELSITYTDVSDISPLKNLIKLKRLYIWENDVSDISPLKNLIKLTRLDIWENDVSDISPLKNLINLTGLDIFNNDVSDISPLKNLIKLKRLYISNNDVSDISALKNLINLTDLSIGGNDVSDISPLKNLIKLKRLYISNNVISDFSPIAGLIPNLEDYAHGDQRSHRCGTLMPPNLEPLKPVRVTPRIEQTIMSSEAGASYGTTKAAVLWESGQNRLWTTAETVASSEEEKYSLVLTVEFLDGWKFADARLRAERAAKEWARWGNVLFKFVSSGKSDIRVRFDDEKKGLGYSRVGAPKGGLEEYWDSDDHTMYLTTDVPFKLALHEFGHALGLIHEHLSPTFAQYFAWKLSGEELYFELSKEFRSYNTPPTQEDKARMDHNILKLREVDVSKSSFDIKSVMTYGLDDHLIDIRPEADQDTKDIFAEKNGIPHNGLGPSLSKRDEKFMEKCYGAPIARAKISGQVRVVGEDDEFFKNEKIDQTKPIHSHIVGHHPLFHGQKDKAMSFKWGGECRVEVYLVTRTITIKDDEVEVGVAALLYEGTSENTDDLEDIRCRSFKVGLGEARSIRISLQNRFWHARDLDARLISCDNLNISFKDGGLRGDLIGGGGDWADVTVTVNASLPLSSTTAAAPSMILASHTSGSETAGLLLSSDVNGDGRVDTADLLLVSNYIRQTGSIAPRVDVNSDGIVTIADLVLVAQYLGQSTSVSLGDSSYPSAPVSVVAPIGLQYSTVSGWIDQARAEDDGSLVFREGIAKLEYLLTLIIPEENALLPNYPNPFNPETWIPYHLAEPADVTLTIYSVDGKVVRRLDLGHQAAGYYQSKARAAYWDGRNNVGERVASGLYFYTLTAGDFAATGKMLIRK